MKQSQLFTILFIVSMLIAVGCNDYVKFEETPFYTEEEQATISAVLDLPPVPDNYQVFSAGIGEFNNNMVATIGRVLFYDKDLSADGSIACASCHHQESAFSDNVSFSEGVHQNLTARNSIALGSLASFDEEYSDNTGEGTPGLFWDERAESVKAQMEETFANPDEMGMDINRISDIVKAKPYYQTLFKIANFGFDGQNSDINEENILTAIETFVRSISSRQSKFDVAAGNNNGFFNEDLQRDWTGFTEAENNGKLLFADNCAGCHGGSVLGNNFSDFGTASVANNGLDMSYEDKGVGEVTKLRRDNGKFKIPGLRNISLTAPYMHDGRFADLGEVIDFYNEGIQAHENLDNQLKGSSGPKKMNFTEKDKSDLIAFFNTLTDEKLLADKKWSDPFKK